MSTSIVLLPITSLTFFIVVNISISCTYYTWYYFLRCSSSLCLAISLAGSLHRTADTCAPNSSSPRHHTCLPQRTLPHTFPATCHLPATCPPLPHKAKPHCSRGGCVGWRYPRDGNGLVDPYLSGVRDGFKMVAATDNNIVATPCGGGAGWRTRIHQSSIPSYILWRMLAFLLAAPAYERVFTFVELSRKLRNSNLLSRLFLV